MVKVYNNYVSVSSRSYILSYLFMILSLDRAYGKDDSFRLLSELSSLLLEKRFIHYT